MRADAERTFCTAERSSPTITATIEMTTSNSKSVNAVRDSNHLRMIATTLDFEEI
jgi:hypothetical protein